MNVALSDAQAFSLVVACAAVAVLAIAMTPPKAAGFTAAVGLAFAMWLRDIGGAAASTSLLLLALLAGTIVRQRREQALEQERLLAESFATTDARREAETLEERARLAREIHDVLAHTLSGLTIQLERTRLVAAARPDTADLAAQLARAHEMAAEGLAEARNAVGALRGDQRADVDAIRRLTDGFTATTGVTVTLDVRGDADSLGAPQQLVLFRTIQEALTNATKHAAPTRISISIDAQEREVSLLVENDSPVSDQSTAVPDSAESTGWGLQGMRERVALAGGRFDAGPTANGFRVDVCVPR